MCGRRIRGRGGRAQRVRRLLALLPSRFAQIRTAIAVVTPTTGHALLTFNNVKRLGLAALGGGEASRNVIRVAAPWFVVRRNRRRMPGLWRRGHGRRWAVLWRVLTAIVSRDGKRLDAVHAVHFPGLAPSAGHALLAVDDG